MEFQRDEFGVYRAQRGPWAASVWRSSVARNWQLRIAHPGTEDTRKNFKTRKAAMERADELIGDE